MADPAEVNRMCNALGVSREEALYYLEGFDWDLASAMEACLIKTLPPVKVKSSPEVSVIEKSTAAESSATRVTINPPRISNQGSSTPSRTIDSRRSSNQNHVGVRIDSRRSWNQVPNPPKELSSELKKESIDRFREVAYGMSLQEVVTFLERFNWDVNIAVNHFMDQRNPQYTSDDVADLPTIEYLQRLPQNYIPMIGVSNLEGFSQEETSAVLAAEMMEHRGPPLPSLSSQSQFHASLGCDLGSSSSSGNSSVDKLRQPRSNASTLRPGPNRDPNSFRTRIPGVVSAFGSLGRMSPVVPFPDLNLMPDSQSSTAGTTAGETVVTGKLEVKAEPIEEWQTPPSYCSDQSATNDLLAEFTRISKLFRSAFKPRQVEGLDGVSVYGLDSGAIVAVPDEDNRELIEPPPGFGDNRVSSVVVSPPPPPRFQRPRELARIANLGHYQRKQLRQVMKRTRMTYESLRVHLVAEDMKHPVLGQGRKRRSDMTAAYMMRDRGLWLNYDKHIVGPITGVEIGDTFFYRMELCVVGLHGQTQAGIDCLTADRSATKEPIATSIIVSGGYEDDEDTGEVLIYTGHGGQDKQHKQCQNQRLEGGNLGMERSMHYGIEVRVIRGIKYENSISSKVYVYDGLYKIVDCWFAVGKSGFGVFKFRLVRMEGQPMMGSAVMKFARTLRSKPWVVRPTGYVSFDISNKKENVPVYLYNDIDGDQEPRHYEYIAKSVFPPGIFGQGGINRTGCDCNNSCTDDCFCARKNGGEFAYDDKGHLLRGKHVVFECGEFCKCGPGCKSRVTQKGLRNRLEVFRSKETGWGVRTLDLIEAGAFICEYAGVVVTRHQADILSMNGDVMVYPGRFTDKWGNWGDLSQVYPGYVRPNYPSLPPLDFAMDVSKMRNVACYISHNKEPNVMVQFVLYDHNHLMFPRVMLFALENISPLAELSLDYGLADEVNGKLAICN